MNQCTHKQRFAWKVGYCTSATEQPEVFYDATVPGAVQLDYAAANGWKPYWQEKDLSVYAWMEDVYWLYCAEITIPKAEEGSSFLVFKGIDYRYRIRFDGELLYEGEGMFGELRLDMNRYAGKNGILQVLLYPIPKASIIWEERDQAKESCKSAVSYGWDFHPRLVPTGIWDEVYLEYGAPVSLVSCYPEVALSEDLINGSIRVPIVLSDEAAVRIDLLDDDGTVIVSKEERTVAKQVVSTIDVNHPKLWWPAGYGEQNLYKLRVVLVETGVCLFEKTVGFRRVSLEMNEGEWAYPDTFPKSRSTAPITLCINGKCIFAKGSNWVPPDVFFGRINESIYEQLLTLVRDANMNILRVWGGGIVNKEPFFDICNRLGIMVWQEFPLACNQYPNKPEYLIVLEQEATSIIQRLRSHPSVVLWCGGNELFNCWSRMTDQSHALRLLNKLCYEHDQNTPFLMTSPLFGMGHGPYSSMETATKEVIESLSDFTNTAYTEFGLSGCNSVEYLQKFCGKEAFDACANVQELLELMPFSAYPIRKKIAPEALMYYFGEEGTPAQIIERLSLLQGMCYRSMFEEMRKQWPRCSMAINWCFDAPWPLICNENLVDWPCEIKPAYYEVKKALRGQLASLRVRSHVYTEDSAFQAEVWLLNDTFDELSDCTIEVVGKYEGIEKPLLTWRADKTSPQKNQQGPCIYWKLPEMNRETLFTVELRCKEKPELNSTYSYFLRPSECKRESGSLNGL